MTSAKPLMSRLLCAYSFTGDKTLSPKSLPQSTTTKRKEGTRWSVVKSPSSGVRKNNNNKKNTFETRIGPPVGGLPSPSPTSTHQNCPSCPAGQTLPAGSSDGAAGRVLAGRLPPTPWLLPPCLNLSLQTAWPDNHTARAASF